MDTSATEIEFDEFGKCGYCRGVRTHIGKSWFPGDDGIELANQKFSLIASESNDKKYDSILGLSGGIDSAVVAIRAIEAGLRPLAVHVDAGWNSIESVKNVRLLVNELGIDLKTIVINWPEMKSVQRAFLKSGTLNQDIPQDHAFFTSLFRIAIDEGISTILSGVNFATESVEPSSWGYSYLDGKQIRSINKKFGDMRLSQYKTLPYKKYKRLSQKSKFKVFEPLNYGPYDPARELKNLEERFDWIPYDGKHAESVFTDWFQSVYLIERYGIDKRRAHLSSKVISGLIDRESALRSIEVPPSTFEKSNRLNDIVSSRLGLTNEELTELIKLPHVENSIFKSAIL
jgi:PP-loop superfamily ATP-utilizing enzyme